MPRRRLSEDEWEDERMIGGQQRNAANARERARMRVLSRAFCRLKTTLPWVPADTKLSKLDTLRLATSYIAHLRALLCLDHDDDIEQTNAVHPLNLTWPFSFQQSPNNNGNVNNINGVNQNDSSPWSDHHNLHHNPTSLSPMASPIGRNEDCNDIYKTSSNKNDINNVNSSHYYNSNNKNSNNDSNSSVTNMYNNNNNHSIYHESLLQIG